MESMWKDLPLDILEKVVTFLPVASVLRVKTVSRKWNRWVSQREFALRHARASSPPEEYVLITMRYDAWETTNPVRGWEVVDVMNRRFSTLSDDFLTEYVLREGIMTVSFSPRVEWSERAFLAADGGLLCVTYFSTHKDSALLVCYPILNKMHHPFSNALTLFRFPRAVCFTPTSVT